jgi:hypothetical protein
MKTVVVALMILCTCSVFARQDQPKPPATPVSFFDVLDLPARIDEPKLEKTSADQILKCALANRSGEQLVGLRLTLMFVDGGNGRITRMSWNEAAEVSAYSIKTLEFHPPLKNQPPPLKTQPKSTSIFLGIDEVIGRDTIWRTVDADKLLRAYARGQQGIVPKVQKLANAGDSPFNPITPPLKP